jgi:nucleoside-diphosphate-sugar epimerase
VRVVVTGATGFIGRHLCAALAAGNVPVLALGRQQPDIDALRGADAVVHLAALAHERASALERAGDYQEFLRVNTMATERLAREAASAGVGHFVFLSTIGVCGEETHGAPFTEQSPPAPRSLYARSKLEAEQRLARVGAETGLRITVLRPTLVYGPGNPGNFLRLLRLVQSGLPLPLGAVCNRRNLAYVGNLVSAIAAALRSADVQGLFLACDSVPISTSELVRRLSRAMGRDARLVPMPVSLLRAAATLVGQGDAARRLLGSLEVDPSKLGRELAWSPPFSLDESLRLTVEWFARAGR